MYIYHAIALQIMQYVQGPGNRGGLGGVRPPLELENYIVKISKIRKIYFFLSIGPPLGKNRSLAPAYI